MNQHEIFGHLYNGLKVKNNCGDIFGFKDNRLFNYTNSQFEFCNFDCLNFNWEIYDEPKWYENMPNIGRLCWVKDYDSQYNNRIAAINKKVGGIYYTVVGIPWKIAIPLTNEEIKQFLVQD